MLRDVATSLAAWLTDYLPEGTPVTFGSPANPSPADRALGLYLYDVREEGDATPADWSPVRNDGGQLVGRLPPQRRYRLTYLITAWAPEPLDEHEILGNILAGCASHHVVPAAALRGSLIDAGQPVTVRCAPQDRFCDPRELWAAWQIPPRASLELSVQAPLSVTLQTNLASPPSRVDVNSSRPPGSARGFGPANGHAGPARSRGRINE